jgi:hypothetical protein
VGLLKSILELFLVFPFINEFDCCIPVCSTTGSIFIMSLSMLTVTDAFLHKKLASSRNLESGFPVHCSLPYFIEWSLNVDLQVYEAGLEPSENVS